MGSIVEPASYTALFVVLISPAIGSFLGVLVDRLPRGEDVVWQPSTCRTCGIRLRVSNLIPVVSFIICRGRCRSCNGAIPAWHLYIEIAAIGLGLIAALVGGSALAIAGTAAFLWLLLGLGLADLIWLRLPNLLTGALVCAGMLVAIADPQRDIGDALLGGLIGFGGFWLIRKGYARLRGREGLGLGDVKLMAGIGAGVGPLALPMLLLVASVAGLVTAIVVAGVNRSKLTGTAKLPFGAFLCGAALLTWFTMHIFPSLTEALVLR